MILNRIRITNLKAYQGEHVLELPRPTAEKTVHLIGAPNGTGKTTLFEAIRACLFATAHEPIIRANYLSRATDASSSDMKVELEFEHESQDYLLSRRWVPKAGRTSTSVDSVTLHSLLQNLATGDSSRNEEEISDFVDTLCPSAIHHFFLFDGEQIQAYTESTATSVRDALERLLGLRTYLDLIKDLDNLESQIRKERQAFDVGTELNKKLERMDIIDARLTAIERSRQEIRKDALEAKKRLADLEREAGRIAEAVDAELQGKRRELEASRQVLGTDLATKEGRVAHLVSHELGVFWFWPQIIQAFEKLKRAEGPQNMPSNADELTEFLANNKEIIIKTLQKDDSSELKSLICDLLCIDKEAELLAEIFNGIEDLVDILIKGRYEILSIIQVITGIRTELMQISHELDALPSPDSLNIDLQELNSRMSEARTIQARHEARLGELAAEEKRLQEEKNELKQDVDRLSSTKRQFRELTDQVDLTDRLQDALRTFIDDYRRTRVEQLEQVINDKFRRLTNLPAILDHIDIDRDTYDIQLRLKSSSKIDAAEQSAGQKEVLAFALIASVVELSQRRLPAVIDTPLARLDARHRKNILTQFLPFAGPQVILLATDTEIGRDERTRLQPYIVSEHHLSRDASTGTTSIGEGYIID